MRTAVVTGLVALVFGAAAGLGAGAYAVRLWAPKELPVKVIERQSSPVNRELALLAQSLRQNAATADDGMARALPAAPVDEVAPDDAQPTPQQRQQSFRERFTAKVASVEKEPRDPVWATQTERAFQRDFAEKAESFQAKLVGVECHSRACLAHVEWDSYATALEKFTAIPHADYSTNCAIAIELGDAPPDTSRTHRATAVFTCKQDDG